MLSEGRHPNDIKTVVRSHNQFCPDIAQIYMWPDAMCLIPSQGLHYNFYDDIFSWRFDFETIILYFLTNPEWSK